MLKNVKLNRVVHPNGYLHFSSENFKYAFPVSTKECISTREYGLILCADRASNREEYFLATNDLIKSLPGLVKNYVKMNIGEIAQECFSSAMIGQDLSFVHELIDTEINRLNILRRLLPSKKC